MKPNEIQQRVLQALETHDGEQSVLMLSQATGLTRQLVQEALDHLETISAATSELIDGRTVYRSTRAKVDVPPNVLQQQSQPRPVAETLRATTGTADIPISQLVRAHLKSHVEGISRAALIKACHGSPGTVDNALSNLRKKGHVVRRDKLLFWIDNPTAPPAEQEAPSAKPPMLMTREETEMPTPVFRAGLFSDGAMEINAASGCLRLDAGEARQLIGFLSRAGAASLQHRVD